MITISQAVQRQCLRKRASVASLNFHQNRLQTAVQLSEPKQRALRRRTGAEALIRSPSRIRAGSSPPTAILNPVIAEGSWNRDYIYLVPAAAGVFEIISRERRRARREGDAADLSSSEL